MNRRLIPVFIFAVAVAAVASFAVYHFVLGSLEASARAPRPIARLLVAARTLQVGTLIRESDLRWKNAAQEPSSQTINDAKEALGRGVVSVIYEGEAFRSGRLAPRGAGAGLAAMIPLGKRAVALRVDEVVGLAGFVVPGMRVDVIVNGGDFDGGRTGTLSRTILQNIEVLSAGQKIEKSAEGKPQDAQVVNLLVTPDQAETLSLASGQAKVQLVLRNPLDTEEAKTHGTSIAALFGRVPNLVTPPPVRRLAPQAVVVEKPIAPQTIEVFNGVKRFQQTLP
jgi:pilus assembly protein CpaB